MSIENWSLRLRVFLFFVLFAGLAIAAVTAGLIFGFRRIDAPEALDGFVLAGIVANLGILATATWIWLLFDENVSRPIIRLSGDLLARARTDVNAQLDPKRAKYLGDLAPAARAVTENLSAARNKLAEAVAQEATRLMEEKEKLTALTAEMPMGVLLMSGTHKIAFYNGAAGTLIGVDGTSALNHTIFDFLNERPVTSAYRRLLAGEGGKGHMLPLTLASLEGGRTLSAHMRLMHAATEDDAAPPYVLTLDDVTADLATHAEREALLSDLIKRLRPSVATLNALVAARDGTVHETSMTPVDRALSAEIRNLTEDLARFDASYEEARADWWPMAQVRASELCDALDTRLAENGYTIISDVREPMELSIDASQIIALLAMIVENLTRDGGRAISLLISREENGGAMIAIGWMGEPLSVDRLESWLKQPLDVGIQGLTGRDALDLHGTDVWPEFGIPSRKVLKLPLRKARRIRGASAASGRSVTYDFDLLDKAPSTELMATNLRDLSYVVFDTETTGLLPSQGDEICQVAAIRVVNGKVVQGEYIDELVDPERPIPESATRVHKITDEMVQGAPKIGEIGRDLHAFARDAVLVAHNAPFDLEFFHRHEAAIGRSFSNPVVDTVLLSAVVFGQSAEHSLDAICDRLGIHIAPEDRHTAMGDTRATASALIKMMAMCEDKDIHTFGDLLDELRRHKRLLQDMNTPQKKV